MRNLCARAGSPWSRPLAAARRRRAARPVAWRRSAWQRPRRRRSADDRDHDDLGDAVAARRSGEYCGVRTEHGDEDHTAAAQGRQARRPADRDDRVRPDRATAQPVITAPARWDLVMRTDRASRMRSPFTGTCWWRGRRTSLASERRRGWRREHRRCSPAPTRIVRSMYRPGWQSTGPARQIATASVTTSTAGPCCWQRTTATTQPVGRRPGRHPSGCRELADAVNAGSLRRRLANADNRSPVRPAAEVRDRVGGARTVRSPSSSRLAATGTPPTGPVPLIVDTDMFSDADDAGALATAFALQRTGETQVLAVAVNTRTSRPAVAVDSWRCAAAIARYYGAAGTPIGTRSTVQRNGDQHAGLGRTVRRR